MLSNNNCDFDLSFDECMAGADRTKCARPRVSGYFHANMRSDYIIFVEMLVLSHKWKRDWLT